MAISTPGMFESRPPKPIVTNNSGSNFLTMPRYSSSRQTTSMTAWPPVIWYSPEPCQISLISSMASRLRPACVTHRDDISDRDVDLAYGPRLWRHDLGLHLHGFDDKQRIALRHHIAHGATFTLKMLPASTALTVSPAHLSQLLVHSVEHRSIRRLRRPRPYTPCRSRARNTPTPRHLRVPRQPGPKPDLAAARTHQGYHDSAGSGFPSVGITRT